MAQGPSTCATRRLFPTSDGFRALITVKVAASLLFAWTGERVKANILRSDIHLKLDDAHISLDLVRIAGWLKAQAPEPAVTPPDGVEPREWAVDRQFYVLCRQAAIKVHKLLKDEEFGLAAHMATVKAAGAMDDRTRESSADSPPASPSANASPQAPRQSSLDSLTPSAMGDTEPTASTAAQARTSPPASAAPQTSVQTTCAGSPGARQSSAPPNASSTTTTAGGSLSSSTATQGGISGLFETTLVIPNPAGEGRADVTGSTSATAPTSIPASAACQSGRQHASEASHSPKNASEVGRALFNTTAGNAEDSGSIGNQSGNQSTVGAITASTGVSTASTCARASSATTATPEAKTATTSATDWNAARRIADDDRPSQPGAPNPHATTSGGYKPKPPRHESTVGAATTNAARPVAEAGAAAQPGAQITGATSSVGGASHHPHGHPKEDVATTATTSANARSANAPPSAPEIAGASKTRRENAGAMPSGSRPAQQPLGQQQVPGAATAGTSANSSRSTAVLVDDSQPGGDKSSETSQQEVIPWPVPDKDQDEYAERLIQLLEAYQFENDEGIIPDFQWETIHNCGQLTGEVPIAFRGTDPRATIDWPHGKPFMRFTYAIVHYTPHDQMIFVPSSRVLHIMAHDPRFHKGAFVVHAPDGAGDFYTCGCFDRKRTTTTPDLRIPLLMTTAKSVMARSHHIPLELRVDVETTITIREEEQPPKRANCKHGAQASGDEEDAEEGEDEEEDAEEQGDETDDGEDSNSAPRKPSKGKQRASRQTARAKRQPTRKNKEPREPRDEKEAWLVNYLGRQKDAKGTPWKDHDLVKIIRRVPERIQLTGKRLLEAVEIVPGMTTLRVADVGAPHGLPGQKVGNKAVAVFLNVHDNWVSDVKLIKTLTDLHKGNREVKQYLKELDGFRTGTQSVIRHIKDRVKASTPTLPAAGKAREHPGSVKRPTKRQRREEPDDEHAAGPSTDRKDYGGQGYVDDEDDEDDEDDDE